MQAEEPAQDDVRSSNPERRRALLRKRFLESAKRQTEPDRLREQLDAAMETLKAFSPAGGQESDAGQLWVYTAHQVPTASDSPERRTDNDAPGGDAQGMRDVGVDEQLAVEVEAWAEGRDLEQVVDSALRDWLARRRATAVLQEMDDKEGSLTEEELEEGRRAWRGGE